MLKGEEFKTGGGGGEGRTNTSSFLRTILLMHPSKRYATAEDFFSQMTAQNFDCHTHGQLNLGWVGAGGTKRSREQVFDLILEKKSVSFRPSWGGNSKVFAPICFFWGGRGRRKERKEKKYTISSPRNICTLRPVRCPCSPSRRCTSAGPCPSPACSASARPREGTRRSAPTPARGATPAAPPAAGGGAEARTPTGRRSTPFFLVWEHSFFHTLYGKTRAPHLWYISTARTEDTGRQRSDFLLPPPPLPLAFSCSLLPSGAKKKERGGGSSFFPSFLPVHTHTPHAQLDYCHEGRGREALLRPPVALFPSIGGFRERSTSLLERPSSPPPPPLPLLCFSSFSSEDRSLSGRE